MLILDLFIKIHIIIQKKLFIKNFIIKYLKTVFY